MKKYYEEPEMNVRNYKLAVGAVMTSDPNPTTDPDSGAGGGGTPIDPDEYFVG